jgi:hypothetical protein
VVRISIAKPTLDQVYLEYTGRSIREEHVDTNTRMPRRGRMSMRMRR